MSTTAGERAMFPYWLHRCVSDVGVSHRSMYSSNHQPQPIVSENSTSTTNQPPNCEICLSFEKSIVFIPCKHIYCCEICSVMLNKCPMCRADIIEKIKIYY